MKSDQLITYAKRIGYSGEMKKDLQTLEKLHYLHTISIPFENLNPFLGLEVPLDISSLTKKMGERNRGGYCFEQNSLFKGVLEEIGFEVRGLAARVLWNRPENLITRRSHMILIVSVEEEDYLVDVGFGGLTLTSPIKLSLGLEQSTPHEVFKLEKMETDFKLQAMVSGNWKTLYRFDLQTQYLEDYEVMNYFLSTHESSPFRNSLIAAKPVGTGRFALSNNQFTCYNNNGEVLKQQLNTVNEIKEVLKKKFLIDLPEGQLLDERLRTIIAQTKEA